MSNSSLSIVTIIIAASTLLITLIHFVWNVIIHKINTKKQLIVKYKKYLGTEFDSYGHQISPTKTKLTVTILNNGNVLQHIDNIQLKFSRQIDNNSKWVAPNILNQPNYPIKIEPSNKFEWTIVNELENLNQSFNNRLNTNDKFKIVVTNTFEKKYFSPTIKIKKLSKNIVGKSP